MDYSLTLLPTRQVDNDGDSLLSTGLCRTLWMHFSEIFKSSMTRKKIIKWILGDPCSSCWLKKKWAYHILAYMMCMSSVGLIVVLVDDAVYLLFVVIWLDDERRQSKYDEDETADKMYCNITQHVTLNLETSLSFTLTTKLTASKETFHWLS